MGTIKKHVILGIASLVIFASSWLVFNELQTFHALTPMLRTLLLISSFLMALTTINIYVL